MKCALAATLLAAAFAMLLLSHRGWNAGALVVAGDQYTNRALVPIPVEPNSAGYDGQFYYRLARDPFTNRWTDHGVKLDVPTYRQQRIFFPLVAWIFSFGNARAVPIIFLIINVASVGLLAWCAASLVRETGSNVWWSAAVWLYPGWTISMTRDCSEILEVALLAAMMLALRRRRRALATILAVCAVLTKETAMLAIAGLAIASPWLLIAIVVHFAWKFTLFHIWHAPPALGTGHFSIPFAGLVHSFGLNRPFPMLTNVEIVALLAIAIAALMSWRHSPLVYTIAFALYLPLIAILDEGFWVEDWSFLRATSEFWVLGGLLGAAARNRVALGVTIVMWAIVAYHVLWLR